MLHHVMDGDHTWMIEPGRGPRLAHRPGDEFGVLLGHKLKRQQHLLDRHLAGKELVATAPDPAHPAEAARLGQQVPAAHQSPRRRARHRGMIAAKGDEAATGRAIAKVSMAYRTAKTAARASP